MSSSNRVSAAYLFFGLALAALTLFGCAGNGDDPLPTGPGSYGSITGTLTASSTVAAVRGIDASVLAATNFTNTLVYLEKDRTISTHPNANGVFTLSPVTFERHNVVAQLTGSNNIQYKIRSGDLDVTTSLPARQTGVLEVKPATRRVRIRVGDAAGSIISTATLSVWGEPFTPVIGNPGYYDSPVLPADETATVTVTVSGRSTVAIPAQFISTETPILETTIPPAGSTNMPPIVTLTPDRLQVVNGGTIAFTATARDPEGSMLSYNWSATAGSIATSSDVRAVWTAPASGNGNTTVTFIAADPSGLIGRVTLTVAYGVSGTQNANPLVEILSDSTTMIKTTPYTLVASATDPDGSSAALTYAWSATNGNFGTTATKQTSWTTPNVTTDTSVTVTVRVTDERGGSTTVSRTFTVIPYGTLTPSAAITAPARNEVMSGGSIQFVGTVRLSNGATLAPAAYAWYLQPAGGSMTGIATATNNFTSLVTTPGSYTAWLMATTTEGLGTTASVPFRINAEPTGLSIAVSPNKTSFLASEAVSFSGSATDPEGQALIYTWFDYSQMYNATSTFGSSNAVANYKDFAPGSHIITLLASDTFGATAATSLTIAVATNTAPVVTMVNPSTTWYALGTPVPFSGYAKDTETAGGFVASTSLSWTCSDPSRFDQLATTSFTHVFTSVGTHVITLQASDTLLAMASVSRSIYINATPTIVMNDADNPASGARYDVGASFTLKAELRDDDNAEPLKIEWYDQNSGTKLAGTTLTGVGPKTHTLTTFLNEHGHHVIEARVIDSCGVKAIATHSLLINTLATPGLTIDYPQYATAPGNIPVLLASAGTQINLAAWASDLETGGLLADSAITCALTPPVGGAIFYNPGQVNLPQFLNPGRYQLMVSTVDTYGGQNAATFTFVVWSARTYLSNGALDTQLSSPTALLLDGDSYYIADHGNSKVKKFSSSFALESAIGGLGSDPGSFTSLVGITKTGGKLYTLEALPGISARIQVWNGTATESNYGAFGTGTVGSALYTNPMSLTSNDTYLFLSDTGVHRLQQLNLASGVADQIMPSTDTAPGNDPVHFDTPLGIRSIESKIYVADYGNSRISVRDPSTLNYVGSWNASSPIDIAKFNKDYFLTIDRSNSQLQFWNTSGGWQMNAGSSGSALGSFDTPVSVVVNGTSIVILENGSGSLQARVHVITLPSDSPW
ncbi:MAG TPA: hypothetical protein PLP29_17595 [Candidatus Ozemobacteraceae bacterium]|nr:hypothetical protein [Candidatus Ozemobacteraceae bacterium]